MNDTTDTDDGFERPDAVPANFLHVPESDSGFAVKRGDLWVSDDEFILNVTPSGRSGVNATIIIKRAARASDSVPTSLGSVAKQRAGWVRGDLSDLNALSDALNYYEKNEAGIGEDKFAYEMRTAVNHARYAVRERLEDDE